ncbi:S41 family peptidase [Bovifimicola ammoniilytica]|uniref:S41 family peptidase n=1 Tax=Bovifimicola ammoniilytica TaxID=2981720 RepID=UPI0008218BC4|nr:S41 family peptidase [Bovifimicola ammoniilytica]MCU6752261.1 S41 family peptidase [Bovifimicola ammoniilytica]SCJ14061.1 Probable CtpA-like serine protease [uncultured Eubacterium sp.]
MDNENKDDINNSNRYYGNNYSENQRYNNGNNYAGNGNYSSVNQYGGNNGYNNGNNFTGNNAYNNVNNGNKHSKKSYFAGLITGVIWGIAVVFILIILSNIIESELTESGKISDNVGTSALTGSSKSSIIKQYIDKYFMEDVDNDILTEGMYKGMLESLNDPYSVYYTKDEVESLKQSSEGEYVGLGISVTQNNETKVITVTKVYDDSPAKDAGIESGDTIYSVNDNVLTDETLDELLVDIKGEEGKEVKMQLKRGEETIDADMKLREVLIDVVSYEMLEDNIGYIIIDQFTGTSTEQVEEAINDLKSQGMERIIVDLRDNPGGQLECIQAILNYFLPKDKLLLYSETKDGEQEKYYTENDGLITDMPLCVLVNENSASASEVFAGVVKCYDRGKLVGTKTFGKGIMQSTFGLSDGTAIKLTIGKYYLPDDSNIHGIGIEPDYEVKLPEDVTNVWALKHPDDPQLTKAIEVVKGLD